MLHDDLLHDPDLADFLAFIDESWQNCPSADLNWADGDVPDRGPACVLVDGWGSLSHPRTKPLFRPLLDSLKPAIEEVNPEVLIRGFSYTFRKRAHSYCPIQTDIPLLDGGASRLFGPYAPPEGVSVMYAGFSWGGPLLLAGAADWVRHQSAANPVALNAQMKGIVLIQPAFSLKEEVGSRVRHATSDISSLAILNLLNRADEMAEMVTDALSILKEAEIDVSMLYWAGDGLLDYSVWAANLDDAGATVKRILLGERKTASSELKRLFREHVMVAHSGPTKEAFKELLRAKPSLIT